MARRRPGACCCGAEPEYDRRLSQRLVTGSWIDHPNVTEVCTSIIVRHLSPELTVVVSLGPLSGSPRPRHREYPHGRFVCRCRTILLRSRRKGRGSCKLTILRGEFPIFHYRVATDLGTVFLLFHWRLITAISTLYSRCPMQ